MIDLAEGRRLIAAATPGSPLIWRYDHGGGRVLIGDTLVADLYQEGDRELVIWLLKNAEALLAAAEADAWRQAAIEGGGTGEMRPGLHRDEGAG